MPADLPAPNFDPDGVMRAWLAGRDEACPACGYNLRGTDGRACPECGVVIAAAIVLGRRAADDDGRPPTPEPGAMWLGALAFMLASGAVNLLVAGAIVARGAWIIVFDPPGRGDRGMAIVPLAAFGLLLLGVLNGAMIYGWVGLRDRWGERSVSARLAMAALAVVCCGVLISWPLLGS
ncbi:MAG TPA: hypothetical protein PLU35_06645 [Phycisphaerales bacterium]|nr:hypothetical protein [Phycisphaerales bacterium]